MIYLVLILLSGVFSLIHIFKAKDKFAKVINATFVASIGVSFIPQPQVAIDGYYLFAIGCIMVVLYAFSDGNFSNNKKIVLIGSGLAQMIGTLFFVGRFPHTDIAYLAGIITIIFFVGFVSRKIKDYANEIGFMAVLMADALIKVSLILFSTGN
jgi:hypothetical protein